MIHHRNQRKGKLPQLFIVAHFTKGLVKPLQLPSFFGQNNVAGHKHDTHLSIKYIKITFCSGLGLF